MLKKNNLTEGLEDVQLGVMSFLSVRFYLLDINSVCAVIFPAMAANFAHTNYPVSHLYIPNRAGPKNMCTSRHALQHAYTDFNEFS